MTAVAANAGQVDHPLLKEREVRTVATIVVTSDRGLAGAYNSNVLRFAERGMEEHGHENRLYLVGKKAITYFKFRGYEFENHTWHGNSDRPGIDDGRNVARAVTKAFSDGDIDEVRLVYTKYHSALTQKPTVVQLLPLPQEELEERQESSQRTRGRATSTNLHPRTSWGCWSLVMSRATSSRGSWRPRPRSMPPGAGR